MSELAKALLEFQKASPDLHRDATNPHFGNKFLSLEGLMSKVLPVANECGLVISQWPSVVENGGGPKAALRTRITHADSGETVEDVMLLQATKEDPQSQGSAITYARRYSLMAALGLVADEDDDGNAAASSPAARTPERTAAPGTTFDEQAFLEATTRAQQPGARPSDQVLHWSKNKGKRLDELTPKQLAWYAEEWKLQDDPSPYDLRLKAAAIALLRDDDEPEALLGDPYPDVPF